MKQTSISPIDFGFSWTSDWYEWDSKAAHKQALQMRNDIVRKMKKDGVKCTAWTLPGQLVKRGGIGSGHPEIEEIVSVYYVSHD